MSSSEGSRRCSGTTKAGNPCKAYAMRGAQLCSAHSRKVGAPAGNQNRKSHGFYVRPSGEGSKKLKNIDDVVADFLGRQQQLSEYIDGQMEQGAEPEELIKLLALSAQNSSRLGRLLRDKRALSGDSADGLLEAVSKLMDEINTSGVLSVTL